MAREYTATEKEHALAVYQAEGLAEAWRQTGIPKPTIASWARRTGLPHTDAAAKTRQATEAASERAAQLREQNKMSLLEHVADLLERMDSPHIEFKNSAKEIREVTYPLPPAAAVQNYATSVGILIDKFRLESGEATARSESRTLTEDLNDHERTALRTAIDRELARRVAGSD